jgi:1-acyl-sn-glycerol-3-phosphate acyltransferase
MYRALRWLIGMALGFYFKRIEAFHSENVPRQGPLLFVSNHPNSLTDSFLIGSVAPRPVHFVATVQLFRFAPLKWILTHCGVIPINRLKDDSKAMRTVADTFDACYRVLEAGGAVGIFPEGITYEDAQLKEIKSGAARMALELEHRHEGKLGLQLVPVGLSYSAKEIYRSEVLVNFGRPLRSAEFVAGYAEHKKDCIRTLTAEIEKQIQALILHLPELEEARLVAGIKSLYIDRFRLEKRATEGRRTEATEDFVLTQQIAAAVHRISVAEPQRASAFASQLERYQRWLRRLRFSGKTNVSGFSPALSNESIPSTFEQSKVLRQGLSMALVAVAGAPIALYGWLHRLIPYTVVKFAIRRFTEPGKRKAQTSTTAIVAGIPIFGAFYGACVFFVNRRFGWQVACWFGLSLPVSGILAHYYLRHLRQLGASIRNFTVLMRAPRATQRLKALREKLLAEIAAASAEAGQKIETTPPKTWT